MWGNVYTREEKKRSHVLPLPVYAQGFLGAVGDVLVVKLSRLWHGFITSRTVYLAEDVFVTRVEWCKRAVFLFHEFLVCYVSERQESESRTPHVSVIAINRYVPDQKPDKTSDGAPDVALDSTPNSKPLLKFFENGKQTLSPYVPLLQKAIPTPLPSSPSESTSSQTRKSTENRKLMLLSCLLPVSKVISTFLRSFHWKSEPLLKFTENRIPTSSPYVPPFPTWKDIPTFLWSHWMHEARNWVSRAEDTMFFSLDGSDRFIYTQNLKDQYVCRTLNIIQGELVSVPELAVLVRTIQEYHESYDFWCYQSTWFCNTIYNTIKTLVEKSALTLQEPHGKPLVYEEVNHRPHVPARAFRWSGWSSKVTMVALS